MSPTMPVNMTDVARAAGVSIGTVSRALSGRDGVAAPTRRRIAQLAEELGYVVSPEASRLSGGRTGRVGIVTPAVNLWYYSEMISGISSEFMEAGVDTVLYPLIGPQRRRQFFEDLPARRKVDALVVLTFPLTEREWNRLEVIGVDVVVAGVVMPGRPSVGIDDELAARQAVGHLLALGHTDIAMITGQDLDFEGNRFAADSARQRGYRLAMQAAGIQEADLVTVTTAWGVAGGALAMNDLLSRRSRPTAIFAYSDELAFGALQTLRRSGINSETLSVIGIDDHPLADAFDLTTIRQSPSDQGGDAARMCLNLLSTADGPESITHATHLVVRRSAVPPRAVTNCSHSPKSGSPSSP